MSTVIIFASLLSLGTPPDIAAGAMLAAPLYGIQPSVMGAYLASGHPGARYSGRCGDPSIGGTCGPYRLHSMWSRRCGYPDAWRHDRVLSSLIAACMLAHSRWQHYEGVGRRRPCKQDHDYRAHPKSSGATRASPRSEWKVLRQVRLEREICGVLCRAMGG